MRRQTLVALAVVAAIAFVGWRSVFVGGWHNSGDGSYACPHSPWHSTLHPLPPDAFGDMLPGLPEACNRDARQVVIGWGVGMLLTVGAAVASIRLGRPGEENEVHARS